MSPGNAYVLAVLDAPRLVKNILRETIENDERYLKSINRPLPLVSLKKLEIEASRIIQDRGPHEEV